MGFAINPSLNYLQINVSSVVEFYRSTTEIALPDARYRGHPFEAYICITLMEGEKRAYVALLNTSLQSVLVYTSDFSAKTGGDYPKVLAEAEAFVTAMGFTMEKVNLDFSSAMREVILKGFRVMRPPTPQKKQFQRAPKLDVPAGLGKELDITNLPSLEIKKDAKEGEAGDALTELQTLRAELASNRAALAQATREKVALEQRLSQELASLKSACEQAMESKRQAEERLASELRERASSEQSKQGQVEKDAVREREKLEISKQLQASKEEIAALKKQLVTAKEAADLAVKKLCQEQKALVEKVELLLSQKEQLEKRYAGEMASSREMLAKANADKVAVETLLAAEKDAGLAAAARLDTLSIAEQSWKEGQQQIEELTRSLAAVKEELSAAETTLKGQGEQRHEDLLQQLAAREEELVVAREELHKLSSEEGRAAEQLRELAAVKEEVAAAKVELARLRETTPGGVEPTAEVGQALKEKEAVEAEYVRLATSSREREAELSDSLATAEAENVRLKQELEIQTQVAAMEQAALRAELRRLIVGGHVDPASLAGQIEVPAAAPLQGAPSVPQQVVYVAHPGAGAPAPPARAMAPEPDILEEIEPEDEADDTPDEPISPDTVVLKEFTNEYGGFYFNGPTSSTDFAIDKSLDCIEYREPSEIVAVFYSSNTVQAVPDSSSIQRCRGYVVALKQAGNYLVYVAWHLTESGKVVVCLPDQQPTDSDSCIQTLMDAISYFEIVGFMMDIADLGTTAKSYRRALKKIPVFRRITGN